MRPMLKSPLIKAVAAAACCVALMSVHAASGQEAQADGIRLGTAEELSEAVLFGLPIDVTICPDGSLVVADMFANNITKLSVDGQLSWQAGRSGQGPGEFQRLYRIACGSGGQVAAYDMTNQEISRFSKDGEYLDRGRLDTRMDFFDGMVLLPSGHIAVAGIGAGVHGVHVFDEESRRLASFGPLPPSENPRALRYWGAGGINLSSDGDILFTLRVPYEIYVFSEAGQELDKIRAPYDMTRGPDDNYVEERTPTGYRISANPDFVARPLPARDLGDGWLLSGRLEGRDTAQWDLFYQGRLVESFTSPDSWLFVAAVDRARKRLYVQAETPDGDTEFLRVSYEFVHTNHPGGK